MLKSCPCDECKALRHERQQRILSEEPSRATVIRERVIRERELSAMSYEDAARQLGFKTRYKVAQLVESGELPAIRIGPRLRIRKTDLDAWLAQQPVVGQ